jgi:hypothetical protein
MTTSILWAYAALTLGFWIHTLYRMATTGRRRERLFGFEVRVLLGLVALVTSAGWILLLPIYGLGRLQVAAERRGQHTLEQLSRWRRGYQLPAIN